MELRYEPARPEDIEALYAFNKELIDRYEDIEAIDYEKVLHWVRRKLETRISEYTCVFAGNQKVGYYHFADVDDKMELDDLYVFPGFRGRGIGTAIVRKCCKEADKTLFLYVFSENKRAISLYRRLGFRVVQEIGITRLIMEKEP